MSETLYLKCAKLLWTNSPREIFYINLSICTHSLFIKIWSLYLRFCLFRFYKRCKLKYLFVCLIVPIFKTTTLKSIKFIIFSANQTFHIFLAKLLCNSLHLSVRPLIHPYGNGGNKVWLKERKTNSYKN